MQPDVEEITVQKALVDALLVLMAAHGITCADLDRKVSERIHDPKYAYPSFEAIRNKPTELQFNFFVLICSVLGVEYDDFVALLKLPEVMEGEYRKWVFC